MEITATGSIFLDGRDTGYVVYADGLSTTVIHGRLGAARELPSKQYDLVGRLDAPHPGPLDFERHFRQALKAMEYFDRL